MLDYSISDHMASYNLYETLDLISENFSIPRVVIHFLQFSDSLSTNI